MLNNKKTYLFAALFAACAFICSTSYAKQQQTAKLSYQHHLNAKELGEKREFTVVLPKSYHTNPSKVYPVIYRLDGVENTGLISSVLERLQNVKAAPEAIIVGIENTDRIRDYYPTVNTEPMGFEGQGGGAAKFLNFIEKELIPYVDDNYRTHDYKIIAGASAAGVFSLYAMQARPGLFQAHIAYSPAIWWNFGATAKSTKAFISKSKQLDSYLYINIGEEAGIMRERYDDMAQFITKNKPEGLKVVTDSFDGVAHGLTSSAGAFFAYKQLFLPTQMPMREFSGNTASIDDYYNRLSKQWGEQITPPNDVVRSLGYNLVDRKQVDQAISVFKYNINLHPKSAEAYYALSYGYEMQGDMASALAQIKTTLQVAGKSHQYYNFFVETEARLQAQLDKL
ncbi:alpha/beta hydrolase-fold protein [Pseudoalteromonas sp. T1lg65]|uniref:alpha/beta hydrolase-fold protein n=1 Tax=Pseudoalteromonas sp. T1lg65 TaxID=2077101 RepID=UPI003F79ECF9